MFPFEDFVLSFYQHVYVTGNPWRVISWSGEKLQTIHVMPKFCRQYEYCLKNSARDFTVCLTASFWIQVNCVLILCLCARARVCVCVRACMRACVRQRERGRRTLITLWNRIQYVTRSHEMSLNLKFGNWRYLHVSNLQVLLVILIFTAVARKRPWSFCQKCRWQVTAKYHFAL